MSKKSLGQHFLKNKSAIQKMIASLELKPGETVIEIGPGKGALTLPLIEKCKEAGCKIIAIEKDRELASELGGLKVDKLEVITGDALKELELITSKLKTYKLVGNIPYYITGKLLRILSELENKPIITVLTIQKEVAERICAQPPKMNLLSAATQFWAEPKILMNLKSTDFDPAPDVDSSIIQLIPKPKTLNAERYYPFIKIAFKQPRKTLLNNLSEGFGKNKQEITKILEQIGLKPDIRPQDLDIKTLIELTRAIQKIRIAFEFSE